MCIRHFNIAGVAWSNFKPGINTNGRTAISNVILSINVVNVSAGVDKALMALKEVGMRLKGGRGRLRLQAVRLQSPRVCWPQHNVQRWQRRQRQRQPFDKRVTHCAAREHKAQTDRHWRRLFRAPNARQQSRRADEHVH